MDQCTIFVSHSSRYSDIAQSLRTSLQNLESKTPLDIKIMEEMWGANDWRLWIEENVRTSNIFLLLYPHANMNMDWCSYELGRFYDADGSRKIVCIKNTDIPEPPPQFQPYQAYSADEEGIRKFIDQLFVSGALTDGKGLNPDVGKPTDKLYERAQVVAQELAQKFTQARVREELYEKRIVLSVRYGETQGFDAEASTIEGNADGLSLLGLNPGATIRWSKLRESIGCSAAWPSELEGALSSISVKLPPALSPFYALGEVYIPVITKVQSIDKVLQQVALIFVTVNEAHLRPLFEWFLPPEMPDAVKLLIRFVRLLFRARWVTLEPRYQEVKYHALQPEQCAKIVDSVAAQFAQITSEAKKRGIAGFDQFLAAFSSDLQADAEACINEFVRLQNALTASSPKDAEDLASRLRDLLDNNAKWLELAAKQLSVTVAGLRRQPN